MDTTSHQGAQSSLARREYRSVPGISDSRRLPRIGKLRLGVKKTARNGKEYPVEIDYFHIDKPAADSSPAERAIHKRFVEAYGEKPKAIDVIVPVEEREIFFPQAYKAYGAAGLKCVGDGSTAQRLGTDGHFHDVEGGCPGPDLCPFAKSIGMTGKPGCKFTASLFVLLPKVSIAGYFQIVTGSKNSVISINSSIETIQQMFGRVSGLAYIDPDSGEAQTALQIVRRPTKIQYEGKSTIHYPVTLEARINLQQLLHLKTAGALGYSPNPALPANAHGETAPHIATEIVPPATTSTVDPNEIATPPPNDEVSHRTEEAHEHPPEEDVSDILSGLDRLKIPQTRHAAILKQDHMRIRARLRQEGVLQ